LASSTAAAAQLVCRRRSTQQLGAGADDPAHTVRKISRRPFSLPRAEQAGQLRSPRTPHVLEQQGVVGVQASLHTDLADEHEYVERAG